MKPQGEIWHKVIKWSGLNTIFQGPHQFSVLQHDIRALTESKVILPKLSMEQ